MKREIYTVRYSGSHARTEYHLESSGFQRNLHREDGPALVYEDGDYSFWLNGEDYTEEEWKKDKRVIIALRKLKFEALGI